jgi:FMN phosphatase YigB (HAD superfamily)
MPFDPDRVSTVTFDPYSTLVDAEAAEAALADRVADPEPVSRLWRSRSLAYAFVANAVDAYQPFCQHGAARTGTPVDRIVHATAGRFDVLGTRHAGMQAARVDRKGTPWEPFGGDPDVTVETLHELADLLGA